MFYKIVKVILTVLVVSGIAYIGYMALNRPDQRTASERVGDAIDSMSESLDKAGQELERRTPSEKLGDAVKDVGDDIQKDDGR